MYYKNSVAVPEVKGKIVLKKKKDATYVLYEYGRIYNKEKKYNVPQRVVIGKIREEDPMTMLPNENYYEHFEETNLPEVREAAYRSAAIKVGANIVIDSVIEEYGLRDKLEETLGDDYTLALDLAAYSIVTEDNAAQHYPDYAFSHPLHSSDMAIASDEKICRFLKEITPNMRAEFLKLWNKDKKGKGRVYVSYDSTNKNSHAVNNRQPLFLIW